MAWAFPATPSAGFLLDQSCYQVMLMSGLFADVLTGDLDVWVRTLQGDTTSSGTVTLSDALYTATQIGETTLAAFDLDLSGGSVSLTDALFAKSLVSTPPRTALCP